LNVKNEAGNPEEGTGSSVLLPSINDATSPRLSANVTYMPDVFGSQPSGMVCKAAEALASLATTPLIEEVALIRARKAPAGVTISKVLFVKFFVIR
jgi:hypothetical protein